MEGEEWSAIQGMKFPKEIAPFSSATVTYKRNELCPGRVAGDIFDIEIQYGNEFTFPYCVHIEESLVPYFESRHVISVELEPLGMNGPESKVLPRNPNYLVMGVTLEDGRVLRARPSALVRYRRRLAGTALVAILVGIAGMAIGSTESMLVQKDIAQAFEHMPFLYWVFGAALVAGTHKLRTALRLPV